MLFSVVLGGVVVRGGGMAAATPAGAVVVVVVVMMVVVVVLRPGAAVLSLCCSRSGAFTARGRGDGCYCCCHAAPVVAAAAAAVPAPGTTTAPAASHASFHGSECAGFLSVRLKFLLLLLKEMYNDRYATKTRPTARSGRASKPCVCMRVWRVEAGDEMGNGRAEMQYVTDHIPGLRAPVERVWQRRQRGRRLQKGHHS